jgi:hypothetical protein
MIIIIKKTQLLKNIYKLLKNIYKLDCFNFFNDFIDITKPNFKFN